MARDREHIFVRRTPAVAPYKPHKGSAIPPPPMPHDRAAWANSRSGELQRSFEEGIQRRTLLGIPSTQAAPGIYLTFESIPDFTQELKSLDAKTHGVELVAVKQLGRVQHATVYLEDTGRRRFLQFFDEFAGGQTLRGGVPHAGLVARIASVRLATLDKLWTESVEPFPPVDELRWWEVWLRSAKHERGVEVERFRQFARSVGIEVGAGALGFRDRTVLLARGTARQFASSLDILGDLAELRAAHPLGAEFVDMPAVDAAEWAAELASRVVPAPSGAPTVCLLDTGVTQGHPLLRDSLAREDCHAFDAVWGGHDDGGLPNQRGHGTEMAGLALYGDLREHLISTLPVQLVHRIESVKVLPPGELNRPEHYGLVTAGGVARPELAAPDTPRVFSLAVGDKIAGGKSRGVPTSWSATVDALAAGRRIDADERGITFLDDPKDLNGRLFVVAAGNVFQLSPRHLDASDAECADDPAQAWNALTVGAYTDLVSLPADSSFRDHGPLAPAGELSPHSATSVAFSDNWPIKPEILLEGGNAILSPHGHYVTRDDSVSLLTTYHEPALRLFSVVSGTSAACSQAGRMAAILRAHYPSLWPETARALLVHSAEWTEPMRRQFAAATGKVTIRRLLRRYGYGVASLERSLSSAANAVTLMVQSEIRPYSKGAMREMHLHSLPWPVDVLQDLEATEVRLRITLSYFVEPNPSRRGWASRFRYASHGLRFHLIGADQSQDEFLKRLNAAALDEDEARPADGDDARWLFGTQTRNKGSLHTDVWVGPASDLARRSILGIVPTSGWWKDQPRHDRSELGVRYGLVVSIESAKMDVDLWTAVAAVVEV